MYRQKTLVPIRDLEGQTVTVWNGTGFSDVMVRKTGESQRLLRVAVRRRDLTYGEDVGHTRYMDCTEYHKFILYAEGVSPADAPRAAAVDLVEGHRLCDFVTSFGVRYEQIVVSVEDRGRVDDTYCYSEPVNHVGIFNGILTGQCTEIIEYSSPEETAVCNLASIALPYFVREPCTCTHLDSVTGKKQHGFGCKFTNEDLTTSIWRDQFDFPLLMSVTERIVKNLNRIIDINYYPTESTRRSNMRHRPIGLGVQGLADVFARLGLAWESPEAAALNQEIFETIYCAATRASVDLAVRDGPYETFAGSPASAGILQPDLWGLDRSAYKTAASLDWDDLRDRVKTQGLRNSLLVAPMPTASTSRILGYNECIEPFTTNIYVRRTLAGEFTVINKYLVADLLAAGLWSTELKDRIVAANGSVQGLTEVPADIKARYKTVWEIKQKTLIDMAADRGAFICQSQSLNLFVADPTIAKLSSMHFYAWKRGLKTGIYYLRTKSAVQAIKFTLDPRLAGGAGAAAATTTSDAGECLMCSS